MKKILFFLFCIGSFLILNAQQYTINKKAINFYKEAQEALRKGNTERALQYILKSKTANNKFSAPWLLEADIYNKQGKKEEEKKAIEAAIAIDSLTNYPYYFFILAENYFNKANYKKAEEFYRQYLVKDKRKQAASQAKYQLDNCIFAQKALKTQKKQPIELFYSDSLPVYWPALDIKNKTLLFTEQDGNKEYIRMRCDSAFYFINFQNHGNYGSPSLTADGSMMYFSMNEGRTGFDIYVAYRLSDTSWSDPIRLEGAVNTDGWDAQPAISADGTRLYFASTREGGKGGSDIWCSKLITRLPNGKQIWSQPECLYFNTPKDEMAPFLYFDNRTLFFASNGYPGMGGKDIYKTDIKNESTPTHLGITINTNHDEFGFIIDSSGEMGYFSSDFQGKRCIYRYRLEKEFTCPRISYLQLKTEDKNGIPLKPAKVLLSNLPQGDTLAHYDMSTITKEMTMTACITENTTILIGVVAKGYLYYSDTLQIRSLPKGKNPLSYTVHLCPIQPGEHLELKGIFFDIDDDQLRPESYTELKYLAEFLRLNPNVKIEISGHTDNTGSLKHNLILSENRAFEVYKYLIINQIPKERLSYRGYGASHPKASNATEEGKAQNRRTEIKIIDI